MASTTPCSGPFLGTVFAFTLAQPPLATYILFGSVGLGMASPYLVVGAFPALVRWLPKPGEWMETVKQLMGFVLLGTVVYLFSTINAVYFIPTLALVIGVWLACWIMFSWSNVEVSPSETIESTTAPLPIR